MRASRTAGNVPNERNGDLGFPDHSGSAIRAAVGDEFPIVPRVSQWKQQDFAARVARTPAEMEDWLLPLVEAGADMLHCSQRRYWEPEFPEIDGGSGLNFVGWAKKVTGAATISLGPVGLSADFFSAFGGQGSGSASLDQLIERMDRDEFDLIAVGRALLSDLNWVKNVRLGDGHKMKGFDTAAMVELV